MPRGDQLSRQFRLLNLLGSSVGRTLEQFREELGCSKRTVQRDLDVLEKAGFPVISQQRNGTTFWKFVDGYQNDLPLPLTIPELLALVFSKGLFAPLRGTPIFQYLESALGKIRARLSPAALTYLRQLENALAVSEFGAKDYSRFREVLETLSTAIVKKLILEVDYFSFHSGAQQTRRYDPYRLWYSNQALYAVGFDHLRGGVRTFAVDRIRAARLTSDRFEVSPDFDFQRLLKNAFPVMLREETTPVRIYFTPEQARYVAERQWHPTQQLESQPDGSAILSLEVADLGEVGRWLGGFGPEAIVLEPPELREAIRAGAERLLALLSRPAPARAPSAVPGKDRGARRAVAARPVPRAFAAAASERGRR